MVAPGAWHTLFFFSDLANEQRLYGTGRNNHGQAGNDGATLPTLIDTSSISAGAMQGVAAGYAHSIIWGIDEVWGFGWNAQGQLGLNDTTDRFVPTAQLHDYSPGSQYI